MDRGEREEVRRRHAVVLNLMSTQGSLQSAANLFDLVWLRLVPSLSSEGVIEDSDELTDVALSTFPSSSTPVEEIQ